MANLVAHDRRPYSTSPHRQLLYRPDAYRQPCSSSPFQCRLDSLLACHPRSPNMEPLLDTRTPLRRHKMAQSSRSDDLQNVQSFDRLCSLWNRKHYQCFGSGYFGQEKGQGERDV